MPRRMLPTAEVPTGVHAAIVRIVDQLAQRRAGREVRAVPST